MFQQIILQIRHWDKKSADYRPIGQIKYVII